MIEVTVSCGTGDRPAERIVEPILAGSRAALAARANTELGLSCPAPRTVQVDIIPSPAVRKGMIIMVNESGQPLRPAYVHSVVSEESADKDGNAVSRSMALVVEYREDQ